jgi:hypothetical protein
MIEEAHGSKSMVLNFGVLRFAVFRSAFSQGDASGPNTSLGPDRGGASTGTGRVPGVLHSVATRSQQILAPVA